MLRRFVLELLGVTGVCNMLLGVLCALGNIHNMGRTLRGQNVPWYHPIFFQKIWTGQRVDCREEIAAVLLYWLHWRPLASLIISPPKLVWLTFLRKLFHNCRMCRLCGRSWNKSINMSCYTESHFLPNLSPKVSLTWMCWPAIPRYLLLQGSQDLESVGHSSLRWYSDS